MLAYPLFKRVIAANSRLLQIGGTHIRAWCWQLGGIRSVSSNMEETSGYSQWSTEKLIDRIASLEQQLKEQTAR